MSFPASQPVEAAFFALSFLGTIVLLNTPAAAELSVCMGDFGWGHLIYLNVFLVNTISWYLMKSAPSSALEAEDMKNVIIWAIVKTGLFHFEMGSFSDKKMWAPYLMRILL